MVFFQALEGSRELENIIGVSDSSCALSAEVQKTQALSKKDFRQYLYSAVLEWSVALRASAAWILWSEQIHLKGPCAANGDMKERQPQRHTSNSAAGGEEKLGRATAFLM